MILFGCFPPSLAALAVTPFLFRVRVLFHVHVLVIVLFLVRFLNFRKRLFKNEKGAFLFLGAVAHCVSSIILFFFIPLLLILFFLLFFLVCSKTSYFLRFFVYFKAFTFHLLNQY